MRIGDGVSGTADAANLRDNQVGIGGRGLVGRYWRTIAVVDRNVQ